MPTNVMPQAPSAGTNSTTPRVEVSPELRHAAQQMAASSGGHAASVLSTARVDELRQSVAARLRAGTPLAGIAREQTALLAALQNQPFAAAMATAFAQEMAAQAKNPDYATPMAEAQRHIDAILKNRVQDTEQFIQLLANPEFTASAQQQATQPAPAPKAFALSTDKTEEIIRRLVQPQDANGAEPAVHVAASALGQRMTHQALANMFRPNGVLRALLVHTLALAWPEAPAGQLEALAGDWLKARHDAAHTVADGLKPEGAIYVEAIRRAEAAQSQKITARTGTLVQRDGAFYIDTPTATVQTPATTPGPVVAREALMMDTL